MFAIHGNKAGLARSLLDTVDAGADVPRLMSDLEAAEGDPVAQLAAWVTFDRRLFERGYDLIGRCARLSVRNLTSTRRTRRVVVAAAKASRGCSAPGRGRSARGGHTGKGERHLLQVSATST